MNKKILYCNDSLEGIFSGIYDAYEMKCIHENTKIKIRENDNFELFSEYIDIVQDEDKSDKVAKTIITTFGQDCYIMICKCLASYNVEKADAVYHMIVYGLRSKLKRNLINDLSNDYVHKVFSFSRETNNEIMHLRGFLRFEELQNGVLFSKISPKNNILTFLAPHFSDRLPGENFVIYDVKRQIFIIHPSYKEWFVVTGDYLVNEELKHSYSEKFYSELFREFCSSISIKERQNTDLQRQNLPLRFQKYMMEIN